MRGTAGSPGVSELLNCHITGRRALHDEIKRGYRKEKEGDQKDGEGEEREGMKEGHLENEGRSRLFDFFFSLTCDPRIQEWRTT